MSKRHRTSHATNSAAGDAHLASPLGKSGTRRYSRATPQFWSNSSTESQTLYPTVVTLDCASAMKPCAPMLILTRQLLPVFEPYNSFFKGIRITTRLLNAAPVNLNSDQLHNLGLFTLRVCRIIMNKPFISTLDDMLYFFAPMHSCPITAVEMQDMPSVLEWISWEVVTQSATSWGVPIKAETSDTIEQDIQDAVIQDRWAEFTRRFEVVNLRRDLTPHSSVGDDSVSSVINQNYWRLKSISGGI
jgi:endoribonuclease Dicer